MPHKNNSSTYIVTYRGSKDSALSHGLMRDGKPFEATRVERDGKSDWAGAGGSGMFYFG